MSISSAARLVARPLLDDDLNFGLVPRPDFDRPVEGRDRDVRLAGRRKMLLFALDVPAEVGADDIDGSRARRAA